MKELETIPMFDELPMDNPEALKKKKKAFRNILYGQLNRLMDHHRVEAATIVKAIGVPYSTFSGWVNSGVSVQMLDSHIKALANFFGVSVDFLAYATPITDKDLELDDLMPEFFYGDGESVLETVEKQTAS